MRRCVDLAAVYRRSLQVMTRRQVPTLDRSALELSRRAFAPASGCKRSSGTGAMSNNSLQADRER
jgi:hypothetical protein